MRSPSHRYVLSIVVVLLTFGSASLGRPRSDRLRFDRLSGRAPLPDPKASACILVDGETGQVLFEKNADVKRPQASTTKIMTAILLIENVPMDDMIEADKDAADTEGSSLYMRPGERVRADDILYALMLRSANDACVAVAKHIAGSISAFAEMMNRKAAEIGASNTHFVTPHGLHVKEHYTTARDLALIARYAMTLPEFAEAVGTGSRTIKRDPANKDTYLRNHSKFLGRYRGADGIKTGYTAAAGRCFVGSATRDGWRLISVVLNSPDMYAETAALMDYGFTNFRPLEALSSGIGIGRVRVIDGVERFVTARPLHRVRYIAPIGTTPRFKTRMAVHTLRAPITRGIRIGEVSVMNDGTLIGAAPLVAGESVRELPARTVQRTAWFRAALTLAAMGVFLYGSARSQDTRRRRHRITAGLRELDTRGQGNG
ncbi:MAG: D-alanyl-D-alanine carboxypeptidase [Chthonomonadales bacterium]|nr:D-alanyl-D-alanine carboxypeptidase [Chthonomonadales bacterium]